MLLLRSAITGFGLAMGAAFFRKYVAPRIGLDESKSGTNAEATPPPGAGAMSHGEPAQA